jgi:hypothetical protein
LVKSSVYIYYKEKLYGYDVKGFAIPYTSMSDNSLSLWERVGVRVDAPDFTPPHPALSPGFGGEEEVLCLPTTWVESSLFG